MVERLYSSSFFKKINCFITRSVLALRDRSWGYYTYFTYLHRCVTGTPVQRGLEDLYGLMSFLELHPYSTRKWWLKLLQSPYENGDDGPLNQFLHKVLWRNEKRFLTESLRIPPQVGPSWGLDWLLIVYFNARIYTSPPSLSLSLSRYIYI